MVKTCTVDVIIEAGAVFGSIDGTGAVLFAIITGAVRWAINFARAVVKAIDFASAVF